MNQLYQWLYTNIAAINFLDEKPELADSGEMSTSPLQIFLDNIVTKIDMSVLLFVTDVSSQSKWGWNVMTTTFRHLWDVMTKAVVMYVTLAPPSLTRWWPPKSGCWCCLDVQRLQAAPAPHEPYHGLSTAKSTRSSFLLSTSPLFSIRNRLCEVC